MSRSISQETRRTLTLTQTLDLDLTNSSRIGSSMHMPPTCSCCSHCIVSTPLYCQVVRSPAWCSEILRHSHSKLDIRRMTSSSKLVSDVLFARLGGILIGWRHFFLNNCCGFDGSDRCASGWFYIVPVGTTNLEAEKAFLARAYGRRTLCVSPLEKLPQSSTGGTQICIRLLQGDPISLSALAQQSTLDGVIVEYWIAWFPTCS